MATNNATNTGLLNTDGQIFIGNSSTGEAAVNTITAGSGITITNGHGTITVATTGSGNVVNQTTGSVTLAAGTTYICNDSGGLITFTFPATAAIGDLYTIIGNSSSGWKALLATTSQQIFFGTASSTAATGYLASTNQYDCISFRCVTANLTWVAFAAQGNITVF